MQQFLTKYIGWIELEDDIFPSNPKIGDVFSPLPEMDFTYDDEMYGEPTWIITREDAAVLNG